MRLQLLILGLTVFLFGRWMLYLPDRVELGPRIVEVRFAPVPMPASGFQPLQLAGAWKLRSEDPRFGGVSALALEQGRFVALSDSGAVIRFPKPGAIAESAFIRELPSGPGNAGYKSRRDSEALARDPAGRGWWVAFEKVNELWLYDRNFGRPLTRIALGPHRWSRNVGVEGLAAGEGSMLLLGERGDSVLELRSRSARTRPVVERAGWISDATRLPSGQLLVLNRSFTPLGIRSSIALLGRSREGYRYGRRFPLQLGPLNNPEGLAAERLRDGRTRLWIVTDDNFKRPLGTLLVALDMPRAPERD